MNIAASSYSDIGGRKVNEDSISLSEDGRSIVAIVADGLGGHSSGETASRIATSVISSELAGAAVSEAKLREAIGLANAAILDASIAHEMKTTVAVLWIDGSIALAATIGDTRVYQFRAGALIAQTTDHSLAQAEVDAGNMRVSEIRTSPYRHHLTRALGVDEELKTDVLPLSLSKGDAFLICSDGVWGEITESEMGNMLKKADKPAEWLNEIRSCVTRRTGQAGDNHSAIAVYIYEVGGQS